MNENFNKFKKKVWTDILIKCILVALATGFVAVNAVLVPCKLTGIHILWVYYVLIALGGIILGGAVAFLIFRTNDKKISMRLDNELKLDERVQTTLQCGSGSGDMIEILKTDTDKHLSNLPARAIPFKNLAATVLCGIIAVAGMVAIPVVSFAVPAVFAQEQPDEEQKDPPRDITDWEYTALDDLIKYVQNSKKMDTTVKNGMLSALGGLRNVLVNGVTQNSLAMFVQNTVTSITNCVKDANAQYPAGSDDQPHPQAQANSEEESYVINTLYDIFGLSQNNGGDNNSSGSDITEPSEGDTEEQPPAIGGGILNENETPFFDPIKGYVTCGSVRAEYMYIVQQALEEGSISSEEWEYIMLTYFADLGKINNED